MTEEELAAQIVARINGGQPAPRDTGLAGQGASGFNEGLAISAGLPVDAATAVVEGMQQRGQQYLSTGVDPETGRPNPLMENPGYQPPRIERPVGGAQFNTEVMDPMIADDAPNTMAERYLRSIARDVGASVPFVLPSVPAMAAAGRTLSFLGLEAASSIGSGSAEQAAEDLGAGEGVQTLAALVGGAAAPIAAYSAMPRAAGETVESLGARRDADYAAVRNSTGTAPQSARDDLMLALRQDLGNEFDEVLHPRAARVLTRAEAFPTNPSISEIDELRRFVRDNVAGSTDPAEARVGQRMVGALDNWLQRTADSGQLGPDAQEAVNRLLSGRDAHARLSRAEAIVGDTGALPRAQRRAATSGTGGNEINAIRQNIRAILDNPNRRQGYTPDEIAAMERVVMGSTTENVARIAGRFAPSSGFLPMAANLGAAATGVGMGGPAGVGLAMAPAAVGFAGKQFGENLTRRNVDRLAELILNGQPLPSRSLSEPQQRVLQALIASRAGLAAQESMTAP